ncbi:MAG TPA: hypothetical protein VGI86_11275 [Acidimicrobiia bacterium]
MSTERAVEPAAAADRRHPSGLDLAAAALAVAYVAYRVALTVGTRIVVGSDSRDYLAAARAPMWSSIVWFGSRPPLMALFIKAAGHSLGHIVWTQTLVSAIAWVVVAYAVRSTLRDGAVAQIGFVVVLLFGLSTNVVQWDFVIGTESLSVALAVLLIAALLWFVASPIWPRAIAVIAVALLFSGIRDPNGLLLVFGAVCLALWWWRQRDAAIAAVAITMVVLGVITSVGSSAGHRFDEPLRDILGYRVFPSRDATAFFLSHGLPLTDAEIASARGQCWGPTPRTGCVVVHNRAAFTWLEHNGTKVYAEYLAHHPRSTLADPVTNTASVVGNVTPVAAFERFGSSLTRAVERWLTPTRQRVLWPMTFLAAALLVWLWRTRRAPRAVVALTAALLVSLIPHMFVLWNGGAIEQTRHALTATIILRIAILLALLLTVDALRCAPRAGPSS